LFEKVFQGGINKDILNICQVLSTLLTKYKINNFGISIDQGGGTNKKKNNKRSNKGNKRKNKKSIRKNRKNKKSNKGNRINNKSKRVNKKSKRKNKKSRRKNKKRRRKSNKRIRGGAEHIDPQLVELALGGLGIFFFHWLAAGLWISLRIIHWMRTGGWKKFVELVTKLCMVWVCRYRCWLRFTFSHPF